MFRGALTLLGLTMIGILSCIYKFHPLLDSGSGFV